MTKKTAPSPNAVAVVTVNWNGWRHTLACLESLRASRGADWRFYIVDNASTDDSLDHLAGLGDDTVVIASAVNGGWTGGNNTAVERALADGFEFIFVLNNDAMVEPDTLSALLAYWRAHDDKKLVLGPVEYDPAGEHVSFIGAVEDPRTGIPAPIQTEGVDPRTLPAVIETPFVKGSGIFAHRSAFEEIGLFDPRFYLNFDDTDWSYRARAAGYGLALLRDARIRHVGSAAIGGVTAPLQTYFLVRNGLLFVEKHGAPGQRMKLMRPYYWAARNLPRRLPRGLWLWSFLTERDGCYPAFRLGLVHYLMGRFGDCPDKVRSWNSDYQQRISA